MVKDTSLIPAERIAGKILLIRRQKVLLDSDLAELYGVETRVLNQAVRRHKGRFPADFMFQLSKKEFDDLKSQFATSSTWGGRRTPPYAFTEQGVAMLSSVLNSQRAIQVNIAIMRAFVRIREMLVAHKGLSAKLVKLERRVTQHDKAILAVVQAIRDLTDPKPPPRKRRIGFHVDEDK